MSGVGGFVGGLLGLSLLEIAVSNSNATGRVGDLFDIASTVLSRWLDPSVPLIPQRATTSTGGTSSGSSSGALGIAGSVLGGVASAATGGLLSSTSPSTSTAPAVGTLL